MTGFLYRSGAELFYAAIWSCLAGTLILVLFAYSRRIKTTLSETGEIFGLDAKESEIIYRSFADMLTGRCCLVSGLILGSIASILHFYFVIPSMVRGGWHSSAAIHYGAVGLVFFDYMMVGSAAWVLIAYAYLLNRILHFTSRLPTITELDRLKRFGVSSLHGAFYFTLIGMLALAYHLGETYFGIPWAPAMTLLTTIFGASFPLLFFFASLMGVHRIIVEVKETELHELRREYWRRHLELMRISHKSGYAMAAERMKELGDTASWVEHIREWPFDLGILRSLVLSVVFPILTYTMGVYLVAIVLHR